MLKFLLAILLGSLLLFAVLLGAALSAFAMLRNGLGWLFWVMGVERAGYYGTLQCCARCGGEMLPYEVETFDREGNPVHGMGKLYFKTTSPWRRVACTESGSDYPLEVGAEGAWPEVSGPHPLAETRPWCRFRKRQRESLN